MSMVLGILFTVCGCVWLWTITFFDTPHHQVIGPAILIGVGGSVLIVTALAMGTELIGPHMVSEPVSVLSAWLLIWQFVACIVMMLMIT